MDLDTISSGDSVSGDNALRTSPVLMVDQELAVIYAYVCFLYFIFNFY